MFCLHLNHIKNGRKTTHTYQASDNDCISLFKQIIYLCTYSISVTVLLVPEVVIACQNADGLQRLTETHVITQDPMQLVFVQEC